MRDWGDRKANFELIDGQSMPESRKPSYIGLVHGNDRKPKRRLFELLRSQELHANQDVTFLTDGGEEVRSLTELVTPEAKHVLDWFHIAMRLTVLEQYALGVAHHDGNEGARLLRKLERTKWLLWHGNQCRAQQQANDLRDDVKVLETDYPHFGKFARSAQEFAVYIRSNAGSLFNYGERILSAMAESTVNAMVSKRFAKRQQMQGPGAAPTCCCKPAPARSTARSGPCSSGGSQGWPTETRAAPVRPRQRDCTHFLMVPIMPRGPRRRGRSATVEAPCSV